MNLIINTTNREWHCSTMSILGENEILIEDFNPTNDQLINSQLYIATEDFLGLELNKIAQEEETAKLNKIALAEILDNLTVTTVNGNTFDANLEARQNMGDAIMAAPIVEMTETYWKLADNTEELITLGELQEAHAKAIIAYGQARNIG